MKSFQLTAVHLVASNYLPEKYDLLSGWASVQRGVFFRDGRIQLSKEASFLRGSRFKPERHRKSGSKRADDWQRSDSKTDNIWTANGQHIGSRMTALLSL